MTPDEIKRSDEKYLNFLLNDLSMLDVIVNFGDFYFFEHCKDLIQKKKKSFNLKPITDVSSRDIIT